MNLLRRRLTALLPLAVIAQSARAAADRPIVDVWKVATCGCCKDWVAHLKANGFEVKTHDTGNAEARERLGMPSKYSACHTAEVAGYAVEGHVPAREIDRLLKERPVAIGLAVPGMPHGSPGMDGPKYGNRTDPYDVLLVERDGRARVFQSYR